MSLKNYCNVTGVLFSLVALAHLSRIVLGLPVLIGDYALPMSISWIATIVPAGLAVWGFRLATSTR